MSSYMEATTETSRAKNESEQHFISNNTTLQFTKSFFVEMMCNSEWAGLSHSFCSH